MLFEVKARDPFMRALNRFLTRLLNLTARRRSDERLREEIESHLAAQMEENIRAGMMDVVVAGGVQSSSTGPVSRWRQPGTDDWDERWISPSHPNTPEAPNLDMSITVGWNSAVAAGVSREEIIEVRGAPQPRLDEQHRDVAFHSQIDA